MLVFVTKILKKYFENKTCNNIFYSRPRDGARHRAGELRVGSELPRQLFVELRSRTAAVSLLAAA